MTMVDRFIELQSLPTSRKVALLTFFTTVLTIFNFSMSHVLLAPLPWVDVNYVDRVSLIALGHQLVVGAIAWEVSRRGYEGRWTFYALALPLLGWLSALIWGFGSISTAMLIFVPLSVVNAAVLFDDRLGRVAAGLATLATLVTVLLLPLTDWLPYAPALRGGDMDLLGSPRFVLTMGILSSLNIAAIFALALAEMSAARLISARLDTAQKLIARYVPAEVAADILEGRFSDVDGHERRKLTVFFSDLVGFSDVAEELEPEDLAVVLNDYFGEMTAIAHRHHGTVDELQGDALLILFGAPRATTDREHALNAVRMATEMHEAMASLNARWRKAGITETLAVRMGINTGVVTVGNFGTPTRMKYAALGKHVNVAARLQAIAEPGSTVISYATYLLVEDDVSCTALGPQQLKGINKPVEAYSVASSGNQTRTNV